MAFVKHNRTET